MRALSAQRSAVFWRGDSDRSRLESGGPDSGLRNVRVVDDARSRLAMLIVIVSESTGKP